MATDLICLDISHYQANPPWADLKAAGILGVILKATEGKTSIDKTYAARRPAALAAGLGLSSYHFLRHGGIAEQMKNFLAVVKPAAGERLVLDWEDSAVTVDELRSAVVELGKHAVEVTIYGSTSFLSERLASLAGDATLAKTSLWAAAYHSLDKGWPSNPAPKIWPAISLWQYTDAAMVGAFGPVDGNVWNGTPESFVAWMTPAAPAPAPGPTPTPIPISIKIAISAAVPIAVTIEQVEAWP